MAVSIAFEHSDVANVTVATNDWKLLLSDIYFQDTKVRDALPITYAPSFRDLALYMARIGKIAYVDPQVTFQGQSGASKRLCVSYLLGLNW